MSKADVKGSSDPGTPDGNLAEQGRAGNIKQNTTNPGVHGRT